MSHELCWLCCTVCVVADKDMDQDTQENVDPVEDIGDTDAYPMDQDDEVPFGEEQTFPQPRAKAIRQKALAVQRPKSKAPKSVKKNGTRILAQEKRRQALELRKAGASYPDIAKALGYHDQSGARKAVMKAFGDVIQEPVQEVKTMQIERLNHMMMVLWPKVQAGDERSMGMALQIMNKIDALMGTEAATQMDVNINQKSAVLIVDGNKDDFIRAAKQMAGLGVQADGTNGTVASVTAQQSITTGPVYPPGMAPSTPVGNPVDNPMEVVDAELVEDTPVQVQEEPMPTKKKFSFGVDPTVKRG